RVADGLIFVFWDLRHMIEWRGWCWSGLDRIAGCLRVIDDRLNGRGRHQRPVEPVTGIVGLPALHGPLLAFRVSQYGKARPLHRQPLAELSAADPAGHEGVVSAPLQQVVAEPVL